MDADLRERVEREAEKHADGKQYLHFGQVELLRGDLCQMVGNSADQQEHGVGHAERDDALLLGVWHR